MTDLLAGQEASFPQPSLPQTRLWLGLSLLVSVIFGTIALWHGFSSEYMIQDDARHHVFWMYRFLDSALFPNDLIADYFQRVAPLGYVWLYKAGSFLQIAPITLNKLLPFGLGLIMTAYCFGVCMELVPIPIAGFMSSLLLNELVWAEDNLISATPRAFVYPIFLGFIYYFMRRSLWPCLGMILLQGLFYPQYVLIIIAVLLIYLVTHPQYFFPEGWAKSLKTDWKKALKTGWEKAWKKRRFNLALTQDPVGVKDIKLCISGIGLAFGILLLFKLTSGGFGPVVTLAEAKQMIEFTDAGRVPFFDENPWCFWFSKKNSGLLAAYNATSRCRLYVGTFPLGFPPLLWTGALLPLMMGRASAFSELTDRKEPFRILGYVFIASLLLFLTAHALLLTLHLPARYTVHSFRILMALSAGIFLTLGARRLIDLVSSYGSGRTLRKMVATGLFTGFLVVAIAFPFLTLDFATKAFIQGRESALYKFIADQPKDIVVASISREADNIPVFSQRSVLVNRENAMPFHHGFYDEFSQRVHDLLEAQYTQRPRVLKDFIRKYDVNFWLIDNDAFDTSYLEKKWVQQYQPTFRQARRQLLQGSRFVLDKVTSQCTVFNGDRVTVIDTQCIMQSQ